MDIRRTPPSFDIPRYLAVLPLFSELGREGLQRLADVHLVFCHCAKHC